MGGGGVAVVVQEYLNFSNIKSIPLSKPWLALLGLLGGIESVKYVYSISNVILWDNSNNKSSTQQHLWYASTRTTFFLS